VPVIATRYEGIIHDFVMLSALRPTQARPRRDQPGSGLHAGSVLGDELMCLTRRWPSGQISGLDAARTSYCVNACPSCRREATPSFR
jgi:hypothetical protein